MKGLNRESSGEDNFKEKIKTITMQNPKGSAAEQLVLKTFLNSKVNPQNIDDEIEWVHEAVKWLYANKVFLQNHYPELDYSDLQELAQDMYVNYLYSQKRLEESIDRTSSILVGINESQKSDYDRETIEKMIQAIWGIAKKSEKLKKPRYLVYSQNSGLEVETNSLSDAIFSAQQLSKKELDAPSLVYDRVTKFPVVAYKGSEDTWFQTNPKSPKLHEDDMIEGYRSGTVGGSGLGIDKSPIEKVLEKPLAEDDMEEGQIYSTGGGAGQSYRKFTPKSRNSLG